MKYIKLFEYYNQLYYEINFSVFNSYTKIQPNVNQEFEDNKIVPFSSMEISKIENILTGNYNCITGGYRSNNDKKYYQSGKKKYDSRSISINRRLIDDYNINLSKQMISEKRYQGLDILVYKIEDEWYLVMVITNIQYREAKSYYKCDQIEGLCQLLKNLTNG